MNARWAGVVFLVVVAAVFAGGQVVIARAGTPRVVLLGSGSHLSTLIVAGEARVLIATGDDGEAFLNAFSRALPLSSRRVDLLILAGDKRDLPVASLALSAIKSRHVMVLDGGLAAHLADLGLDGDALLNHGARLSLPNGIVATIEMTRDHEADSAFPSGWQVVIERATTRIRVASDATSLSGFHDRRPASLLALVGVPPLEPIFGSFFGLAVSSAIKDPSPLIAGRESAVPVLKIEPGRAESLTFTSTGLRLPKHGRMIAPAPVDQATVTPRAAIEATNSARMSSRKVGFVSTSNPVNARALAVSSVLA